MKRTCVLFIIVFIAALTKAAPIKVTTKQLDEAVDNLRKALAAKPEVSSNGPEYKSVLVKWIQDTDDQILRALLPRIQSTVKPRATQTRKSRPRPGPKASAYEDTLSAQNIHRRLLAMSQEGSGAQLRVFLASMSTPEGQKAMQPLNIKKEIIDELLRQINADKEQQTKAKQTFKIIMQSVTKKELPKLRPVYIVYLQYDLQQKAIQTVKSATPEQLINLFNVLVRAEKRFKFDGISFANVLDQAKKSSKGMSDAVDTLNKWIEKTDVKNLRRINHYMTLTQREGVTFLKVKTGISQKIESKTSAQLIEFLEVLETTDGKTLLGKLSVKPSSSVPDLIKKLKSGVKTDEAAVKKELQEWVNKLTLNDMKEIQNSRTLFIQYRERKSLTLLIQKSDDKNLTSILTFLSNKESSGTKFDGIKFTELKDKLTKDGAGSSKEIKTTIIGWIAKVKFEQLASLKSYSITGSTPISGPQSNNNKVVIQAIQNPSAGTKAQKNAPAAITTTTAANKPTTKNPSNSTTTIKAGTARPVQQTASTTTLKPTTRNPTNSTSTTTIKPSTVKPGQNSTTATITTPKPTTKKPRRFFGFKLPDKSTKQAVKKTTTASTAITSLGDIKTAAQFQQFILKENSKVSPTAENVKKALAQICVYAKTDDVTTVFVTSTKGLSGYAVKGLTEQLFRVQVVKMNDRIKKMRSENDWKVLRKDLENWVGKWTTNKSSLFTVWYRRGVQGNK